MPRSNQDAVDRWRAYCLTSHYENTSVATHARPRQRWLILCLVRPMTRISTVVVAAATMLLAGRNVLARIGETEQQIEARYGKSLGVLSHGNEPLMKTYRKADLDIAVTYVDGISQKEFFSHKDKSGLTATEIDVLLAANSEGKKWIEQSLPSFFHGRAWKLEGSDRVAQYHEKQHALAIVSTGAEAIGDERRSRADKEKLKDF
jgi:hypothetical protein